MQRREESVEKQKESLPVDIFHQPHHTLRALMTYLCSPQASSTLPFRVGYLYNSKFGKKD